MIADGIFVHMPGLLTTEQVEQVKNQLEQAEFIDGRATASMAAKDVKNNLQLNTQQQSLVQSLQMTFLQALNGSPLFQAALFPKNIYNPLFSRYEPGMYYGWHVDSPLMGYPPVRTDIAMTVFLNEPGEYEGGELEIQSPTGLLQYKLAAGDAICYPCNYLHRVNEVSHGQRQVLVTWIQSMVKHAAQRDILFKLYQLHKVLYEKGNNDEANELLQNHSNLLRMWSDV